MIDLPVRVPLTHTNPMDWFAVFEQQPGTCLWFMAEEQADTPRYAFLGVEPFKTVEATGPQDVSFWTRLEHCWQQPMTAKTTSSRVYPFEGGLMGYWGYELLQTLEPEVPIHPRQLHHLPLAQVGAYDVVLAFDLKHNTAHLISSGYPEQAPERRQSRATQRAQAVVSAFQKKYTWSLSDKPKATFKPIWSAQAYEKAVKQCQDWIRAGDLFEINISTPWQGQLATPLSAAQLLNRIWQQCAPPFGGAMITGEDEGIFSLSPERFVRVRDKKIDTYPIKGTAKRQACPKADEQIKQQLLTSDKERAENIMIVDLMRNDLSRCCDLNSIEVPELCQLETYSHVHHLVSKIQGVVRSEMSPLAVLQTLFPAGSITGAPKVSAMQHIAAIEAAQRGPYCGITGYIDWSGDMDTAVTIRTMMKTQQSLVFHVGGAVTIDSVPEEEHAETLAKAASLLSLFDSKAASAW